MPTTFSSGARSPHHSTCLSTVGDAFRFLRPLGTGAAGTVWSVSNRSAASTSRRIGDPSNAHNNHPNSVTSADNEGGSKSESQRCACDECYGIVMTAVAPPLALSSSSSSPSTNGERPRILNASPSLPPAAASPTTTQSVAIKFVPRDVMLERHTIQNKINNNNNTINHNHHNHPQSMTSSRASAMLVSHASATTPSPTTAPSPTPAPPPPPLYYLKETKKAIRGRTEYEVSKSLIQLATVIETLSPSGESSARQHRQQHGHAAGQQNPRLRSHSCPVAAKMMKSGSNQQRSLCPMRSASLSPSTSGTMVASPSFSNAAAPTDRSALSKNASFSHQQQHQFLQYPRYLPRYYSTWHTQEHICYVMQHYANGSLREALQLRTTSLGTCEKELHNVRRIKTDEKMEAARRERERRQINRIRQQQLERRNHRATTSRQRTVSIVSQGAEDGNNSNINNRRRNLSMSDGSIIVGDNHSSSAMATPTTDGTTTASGLDSPISPLRDNTNSNINNHQKLSVSALSSPQEEFPLLAQDHQQRRRLSSRAFSACGGDQQNEMTNNSSPPSRTNSDMYNNDNHNTMNYQHHRVQSFRSPSSSVRNGHHHNDDSAVMTTPYHHLLMRGEEGSEISESLVQSFALRRYSSFAGGERSPMSPSSSSPQSAQRSRRGTRGVASNDGSGEGKEEDLAKDDHTVSVVRMEKIGLSGDIVGDCGEEDDDDDDIDELMLGRSGDSNHHHRHCNSNSSNNVGGVGSHLMGADSPASARSPIDLSSEPPSPTKVGHNRRYSEQPPHNNNKVTPLVGVKRRLPPTEMDDAFFALPSPALSPSSSATNRQQQQYLNNRPATNNNNAPTTATTCTSSAALPLHPSLRAPLTPRIDNEDVLKHTAAQILVALQFLHHHAIIYRDLKTENILVDREGYVVLGDFDSCRPMGLEGLWGKRRSDADDKKNGNTPCNNTPFVSNTSIVSNSSAAFPTFLTGRPLRTLDGTGPAPPSSTSSSDPSALSPSTSGAAAAATGTHHPPPQHRRVTSLVGTVDYLCPEVISDAPFGTAVDAWGFGVLLFELATGVPPFRGGGPQQQKGTAAEKKQQQQQVGGGGADSPHHHQKLLAVLPVDKDKAVVRAIVAHAHANGFSTRDAEVYSHGTRKQQQQIVGHHHAHQYHSNADIGSDEDLFSAASYANFTQHQLTLLASAAADARKQQQQQTMTALTAANVANASKGDAPQQHANDASSNNSNNNNGGGGGGGGFFKTLITKLFSNNTNEKEESNAVVREKGSKTTLSSAQLKTTNVTALPIKSITTTMAVSHRATNAKAGNDTIVGNTIVSLLPSVPSPPPSPPPRARNHPHENHQRCRAPTRSSPHSCNGRGDDDGGDAACSGGSGSGTPFGSGSCGAVGSRPVSPSSLNNSAVMLSHNSRRQSSPASAPPREVEGGAATPIRSQKPYPDGSTLASDDTYEGEQQSAHGRQRDDREDADGEEDFEAVLDHYERLAMDARTYKMSPALLDLLQGLLHPHPHKRLTLDQCRRHHWWHYSDGYANPAASLAATRANTTASPGAVVAGGNASSSSGRDGSVVTSLVANNVFYNLYRFTEAPLLRFLQGRPPFPPQRQGERVDMNHDMEGVSLLPTVSETCDDLCGQIGTSTIPLMKQLIAAERRRTFVNKHYNKKPTSNSNGNGGDHNLSHDDSDDFITPQQASMRNLLKGERLTASTLASFYADALTAADFVDEEDDVDNNGHAEDFDDDYDGGEGNPTRKQLTSINGTGRDKSLGRGLFPSAGICRHSDDAIFDIEMPPILQLERHYQEYICDSEGDEKKEENKPLIEHVHIQNVTGPVNGVSKDPATKPSQINLSDDDDETPVRRNLATRPVQQQSSAVTINTDSSSAAREIFDVEQLVSSTADGHSPHRSPQHGKGKYSTPCIETTTTANPPNDIAFESENNSSSQLGRGPSL